MLIQFAITYHFNLTNRLHFSLRLFSIRSQMTSKCRKNEKVTHEALTECATCMGYLCVSPLIGFSINLLAFYHECRSLIGYATHVLFGDR